jgi:hypothetical protein
MQKCQIEFRKLIKSNITIYIGRLSTKFENLTFMLNINDIISLKKIMTFHYLPNNEVDLFDLIYQKNLKFFETINFFLNNLKC